jgi:hypothetical protein
MLGLGPLFTTYSWASPIWEPLQDDLRDILEAPPLLLREKKSCSSLCAY